MLELRRLSAGYPRHPVLEDIDLNLPTGAVTVLAGPNGCGKSTLLKAIAGILDSSGEILLNGEALPALSSQERARRVAFLPQSRTVPELTVKRLVLHGRFPYLSYPRRYRREDYAAADAALEMLGISQLGDRMLASLSGGQRQKAYLAMILAQDTQVILLDEPTTFLDISHQMQTLTLAKQLANAGKTPVLVLHDLTLALEYADHLVVLEQGAVAAQGTPEAVYAQGILPKIFGVPLARTETQAGPKYFYTPEIPAPGCR